MTRHAQPSLPALRRLGKIAAALALAAVFAQFPAYFGQYLQRLGGRAEQAREQAERIYAAAEAEAMTAEGYIQVFLESAVSAHRRQGRILAQELGDAERLTRAYETLRQAGPLARPFTFARHFEARIARRTLADFAPGLVLSAESLFYALLGALSALGLASGFKRLADYRQWSAKPQ